MRKIILILLFVLSIQAFSDGMHVINGDFTSDIEISYNNLDKVCSITIYTNDGLKRGLSFSSSYDGYIKMHNQLLDYMIHKTTGYKSIHSIIIDETNYKIIFDNSINGLEINKNSF